MQRSGRVLLVLKRASARARARDGEEITNYDLFVALVFEEGTTLRDRLARQSGGPLSNLLEMGKAISNRSMASPILRFSREAGDLLAKADEHARLSLRNEIDLEDLVVAFEQYQILQMAYDEDLNRARRFTDLGYVPELPHFELDSADNSAVEDFDCNDVL